MLEKENIRPEKFGYDRPSPKLLGFLAKHYGLKNYVP
jgi:alpha-tubulin N-acetyltransferase 1